MRAAHLYLRHRALVHADVRREYGLDRAAWRATELAEAAELLWGLSGQSRTVAAISAARETKQPRRGRPAPASRPRATVDLSRGVPGPADQARLQAINRLGQMTRTQR